MHRKLIIKLYGTISKLEKLEPDLQLVSDSQDVNEIKSYIGNFKRLEPFDSFFVKIEDGDYSEIYGFTGIVPYSTTLVYLITLLYT